VEETMSNKFEAHLQRGGTGVPEMMRLLKAYAEHGDEQRLKDQVFKEHILGKTSTYMEKDVFYAFRRRFTRLNDLPRSILAARVISLPISGAAKTQLILPYFLAADVMANHFYEKLVLARIYSPEATLEVSEVYDYFEQISGAHTEIASWSDKVRRRWCQGFMVFLRQFGMLDPKPGKRLRRMWLLPEPFAFYWMWFWQQDESYQTADRSTWWPTLQVDQASKNELFTEGQLRDWWRIQQAGEIVQFQPTYQTLEEWIHHGLA
jgi:hypothetical protein